MIFEAKTASGTIYRIDTDSREWSRTTSYGAEDRHFDISNLLVGPADGSLPRLPLEEGSEWEDSDRPVAGKALFIRGRGRHDWWRSTKIETVEEID